MRPYAGTARRGCVTFGIVCLLGLLVPGCDEAESAGVPDLSPAPDLAVPDLPPLPDAAPLPPDLGSEACRKNMGQPCTKNGGECGAQGTCLLTSANAGVCSCICTPGGFNTYDSSPGFWQHKSYCGYIGLDGTSGYSNLCVKRCTPKLGANDCAPGVACHPQSGAWAKGYAGCLLPACTMDSECPVTTHTPCDTLLKACPAGEVCKALSTVTTAGVCTRPGKCDLKSGLCAPHALGKASARVGDPCKSDLECAGNMTCFSEFDQGKHLRAAGKSCTNNADCCSGWCSSAKCTPGPCVVQHRNGYCATTGCTYSNTLKHATCGSGSACNTFYYGGVCQLMCQLAQAGTCRNNAKDRWGDYECRDFWEFIDYVSNKPTTKLCDFGTDWRCSWLPQPHVCEHLGIAHSNNKTNMKCRSLKNAVLSDKNDPSGFCLDDTASGK